MFEATILAFGKIVYREDFMNITNNKEIMIFIRVYKSSNLKYFILMLVDEFEKILRTPIFLKLNYFI